MIDIIGVLYEDDAALPGWHINITQEYLDDHPELSPFVVVPSALRRVWAGDDPVNPTTTVALKFDSEAISQEYI